MKPELKQVAELNQNDFERHPAWVHCHVIDYDKPWYDETDEDTVRPCEFPVPTDPNVELYLVRASATFANGRVLPGFITPDQWEWEDASTAEKMGFLQPHLFLPSGDVVGFWEGWHGTDVERIEHVVRDRNRLYVTSALEASEIFPILFEAEPVTTLFPTSVSIEGFYFITLLGSYEDPRDEVGFEW